jgi:hypothetical protein
MWRPRSPDAPVSMTTVMDQQSVASAHTASARPVSLPTFPSGSIVAPHTRTTAHGQPNGMSSCGEVSRHILPTRAGCRRVGEREGLAMGGAWFVRADGPGCQNQRRVSETLFAQVVSIV